MATILKNILNFANLVVGVPALLPHRLNLNDIPLIPNIGGANAAGFTLSADDTNVSVTRTAAAASGAARVYVEHWHTIEDAEPLPGGIPPAYFPLFFGNATGGGAAAPGNNGAMFFGTTSGTGSTQNDYAATVAVGAPVPFPQNGPTTVGAPATRSGVSTTNFLIANTGIYEVSWQVGFTEASQLQLAANGVAIANTCASSGAGTQQNSNTVIVALTAADVLTLINPAGNATALTVTPANGSLTHAQAPNIVIKQIG